MKTPFLDGQLALCRDRLGKEPGEALEREEFDAYREASLRRTVAWVSRESAFYRELFRELGIEPEEIRSFPDVQKLPFTFPSDLRDYPGRFLCRSPRYIQKPVSYRSSGTTGLQKQIFFSGTDLDRMRSFTGMAMCSIADPEDARILCLMTNTQGRGAANYFAEAVSAFGMKVVIADMTADSDEIVSLSERNHCNIWFGDIGTIYRVAKECGEYRDLTRLGIRLVYVTMGNVSSPAREFLRKCFSCEVITHYGLTEVGWGFAIEKSDGSGYYSNELDVYTEVVDPATGCPLPDGSPGELTYTLIGRDAMPLIRYRSGDIAALWRARTRDEMDTIGPIQYRLEGLLRAPSGAFLAPPLIEDVLYRFPEAVDYRLYGDEKGWRIEVAALEGQTRSTLERALYHSLQSLPACAELPLRSVKLLSPSALRRYCYEKKRFIAEDLSSP